MIELPQYLIDRFWSKVDKTSDPDGHWLWIGRKDIGGYGIFSYYPTPGKRRMVRTHRLAYLLLHPELDIIPDGLFVLHTPPCVTRHCVLHTYLGTYQDNSDDKVLLGRQACTVNNNLGQHKYPERYPRGEKVHTAKLTEDDIRAIRASRGIKTQKALAEQYNTPQTNISNIQLGKTWKSISDGITTVRLNLKGSRHPSALFTEETIRAIRAEYTGKHGEQAALARKHGTHPKTINHIVRRITWTHI